MKTLSSFPRWQLTRWRQAERLNFGDKRVPVRRYGPGSMTPGAQIAKTAALR